MSETHVTYRVWSGCKAPLNLEYDGRLIGEIARELTVDCDALLALAEEISRCRYLSARACEETHRVWADRIREACGVGE